VAEGGGAVVLMRWWWAVRSRNTRGGGGEGFGPKPATELPWLGCGCTMWNSSGGWCVGWHGGAYKVMVVVGGPCARKMRGGEGVGPKPETEPLWLGLGHAVWNGDGGWCLGVRRWHVPGGGGGVVRSRNTRRGGGFG
jgi:hypothetical protein